MAAAGPWTITCPQCRQTFELDVSLVAQAGSSVFVRINREKLYGHAAQCPGRPDALEATPVADQAAAAVVDRRTLAGRVHRFLDMAAYVAEGGSRACTMCGKPGKACLIRLRGGGPGKRGTPCCDACAGGNTHPAPGEVHGSCGEWAKVHHANKADQ